MGEWKAVANEEDDVETSYTIKPPAWTAAKVPVLPALPGLERLGSLASRSARPEPSTLDGLAGTASGQ
jgi:hypothetical protein